MKIDNGIYSARQAANELCSQWGFSQGPWCFRVLLNVGIYVLPAVLLLGMSVASVAVMFVMFAATFTLVSGFIMLWAFLPGMGLSSIIYIVAVAFRQWD